DGTFKLLLTFNESYPNKPATVPKYAPSERLCEWRALLQNCWSPTHNVAVVLMSIQ
ncbi:uncharacterized protein EI90DRAFT_2812479, partial [Cantharellus anzutake]|uniref:uncharacterized protein n=1 Tax=Cantharellus anzutake TaxID=1750568 RepID=UPI0019083D17